MATFPTTSTQVVDTLCRKYDIIQLSKLVAPALVKHDQAPPPTTTTTGRDTKGLFHLHTCTFDITLAPPVQYFHRWGQDGPLVNPAYTAYTDFKQDVCGKIDPLAPLVLVGPQQGTLRSTLIPNGAHKTTIHDGPPEIGFYLATSHFARPLFSSPYHPYDSTAAAEWSPSGNNTWELDSWLKAALSLHPGAPTLRRSKFRDDKIRFHLDPTLTIMWVPAEDGGVDLQFIVTVTVIADFEAILTPLPPVGHDMLGLVLHSLLPSPTAQGYDRDPRAAALQRFYEFLRPAPDLPISFPVDMLQPPEMTSPLLPFQKRTVALLLQREQAPLLPQAEDKKRVTVSDPQGFWSTWAFGEDLGRMAFRRMTGTLVSLDHLGIYSVKGKDKETVEYLADGLSAQEKAALDCVIDLTRVRGTMLCEEMGLGKTVEAIALTILHRHPSSTVRTLPLARNSNDDRAQDAEEVVPVINLLKGVPDLDKAHIRDWVEAESFAFEGKSVWDESSQLTVTEVAATLIVTPPSLLRQWVSEIRRHCPALRVCVYDGWKSLQKGIQKQHAAALSESAKRQRQSSDTSYRKTVKKYQRLNSGRRIKTESDDEGDIEVMEPVESSLDICQRRFLEYVRAHDVVITTYNDRNQKALLLRAILMTVTADLKVANPVPPRSRRSTANYQLNERPRSPLVMAKWWRVIMDEVQLHGDSSAAADMVSLIPRFNSLAVSGTPAKADIKDLIGSLKFLRVPVLPHDSRLWHRLQQPSMRQALEGVFTTLAVRTTKRDVAAEFKLPAQSRFVVPIELSDIEMHYYNDTLERQRRVLDLPVDPRGERPVDWRLDLAKFRECLIALRQICTHIQVGQMQTTGHRRERLRLGRELMTMKEALQRMRDEHHAQMVVDERAQLRTMVRRAQLMILDESSPTRFESALRLYDVIRDKLDRQQEFVKENMAPAKEDKIKELNDDGGGGSGSESESEASDDAPDRVLSQHERERRAAQTATMVALREIQLVRHQCWFFEGDIHHMLKNEEKEVLSYDHAEAVRKQILARPLAVANASIARMHRALKRSQAVKKVEELQAHFATFKGSIHSDDFARQANTLLEIMNGNSELVFHWRQKIIDLLSTPVESEVEEPDPVNGTEVVNPEEEHYAKALQAQGDVEAHLIAYAAAVADRKEFLFEERSTLATHDARITKQRTTKAAELARLDAEIVTVGDVSELAEKLLRERQAFRDARKRHECNRPIKGIIFGLGHIINGDHRDEEKAIARRISDPLKKFVDRQTEMTQNLTKELELFRATFNRRVTYFASLQEISDLVSAPDFKSVQDDLQDTQARINELEAILAKASVKARYLAYLGSKTADADLKDDCIICFGSSDNTKGVLLGCGHFFCRSCYEEYSSTTRSNKCPQCRATIERNKISRITFNRPAVAKNEVATSAAREREIEPSSDELEESGATLDDAGKDGEDEDARRKAELDRLRYIDLERARSINRMDIMGEYGSKISFLIKHLLWYKMNEPDTRHVIFSNWSDSLNIVIRALQANYISFVSFDSTRRGKEDVVEKFKNDPSISVFLLHAERESSGLTLTSCRVVHLLEPVLKHSFELQAIGRVDRLGQDQETYVFCYATTDTVESRILAQGVRNGISIYLNDGDAEETVANLPNVASAAQKGGDVSYDGDEDELLKLIL